MELAERTIDAAVSANMLWQPINLYPFGDLHLEGGAHVDMFKRDLDKAMADEHGYFLGMADFTDIASPSNRQRLRSAALYDSITTALDDQGERDVEKTLRLLKGTEGRWLGFLEGHHFWEFNDGTTTDMRIARAMRAPFLGSCAFVRLRFGGSAPGRHQTCTIWCAHGAGGGVKMSAPLNKIENIMHAFDADIYLIGHQHKAVAAPLDQLYMTSKQPYRIAHRRRIAACTGGYLRSYLLGNRVGGVPRGGYAERAMLSPTALGHIQIHITPTYRAGLDLKVTL